MKDIGLLRKNIHILEKAKEENRSNDKRKSHSKTLYQQCKLALSEKEQKWCEEVLFNESRDEEPYLSQDYFKHQVIGSRRSIRKWEHDEPIDIDVYRELLWAAQWSPSSCNRQPCDFILVNNRDKIKMISQIKRQVFIAKAPSCIVVLLNKSCYQNDESYFGGLDAGAAIQNLLLMAHHLGLGACWVNASPLEYKKGEQDQLNRVFKVPSSYRIVSFIPIGELSVGYSKKPPGRKFYPVRIDAFDYTIME